MTPLDYLNRYYNLDVPIDSENGATQWVTVKVSRYRLGEHGLKPREKFLNTLRPYLDKPGETVSVKVKTDLGNIEEFTFTSRGQIAPFVAAPFFGKGSPEDVQIVLQLMVRYGLIGRTQAEIQAYCDEVEDKRQMGNIGLDCNGFIGNFLRHTVGGFRWDQKPGKGDDASLASTTVGTLLRNSGARIKDVDELVTNCVYGLGYVNTAGNVIERVEGKHVAHIMITQPLTLFKVPWSGLRGLEDQLPIFDAVEATGRGKGLVVSQYSVLDIDKKGVFTVWRGSQSEKMRVQVYRIFGF